MDVEIRKYINLKKAEVAPYENVLKFWRENCENYPHLARLARKVLSIPASSAAVERIFSLLKRLDPAARARMNYETLTHLIRMITLENFDEYNLV